VPVDVADAVNKYIKLRDLLSARKKKVEEDNKPYNQAMEALENWLLNELNNANANNIATSAGTVYKVTRSSVSVKDWEAALSFVKDNELWGALTRGISKEVVEEYIKENQEAFPGVELNSIIKINVRR
jgi:hypothetical protein